MERLKLNKASLLGLAHLRGKTHSWAKKIPLNEILVENSSYQSFKLRNRLLKGGLMQAKCYSCKNTTWLEKPIPLELEHVNGNHSDNRIENLTLLCPNCHALTPTYRGKNKKC